MQIYKTPVRDMMFCLEAHEFEAVQALSETYGFFDPETVARLQQKRRMPVNSEDGMQLARELGAYKYIECSALTQQGLKGVFDDSIRCVLDAMKKPKKKKKKCVVA